MKKASSNVLSIKNSIRSLMSGERIPDSVPARYNYGKYVKLRWKIGIRKYV